MIEYRLEDHTYTLSYPDLKRKFLAYEDLTDSEFMADLPNILHFTVFVCWFKGLQAHDVLSDLGIIHELVHLMCLDRYGNGEDLESGTSLNAIRKLWADTVRLS